ncbi:MAG: peroxidase-related enzyme [Cyclobacteriaceae bacterium]
MALIETILPENATDELKDIYDGLIKSRGKIADVHMIQSLNPESITRHMDLYMTIMFGKSPIKRVHREMMAVVVSKANQCEYCQVHHLEAVNSYWKDEKRAAQLKADYTQAGLDATELAMCAYADILTRHPESANDESLIAPLKDQGLSDRAILDATLVIAYFNFVNRIVLSLGVTLEENPGGYNYE